jgi:phospholipid transport system substrate-binding protein
MRVPKVVLILFLLILPIRGYAIGPMDQMKVTIDGVLNILKDEELKRPENRARRRQLLRQLIYRRFDFEEMSRRALGIHWARRSAVERREFVPLFSELLERSYINRIESYTDERILFTEERIDDGYAVVRTRIISRDNTVTPVDYRLMRRGSEWLVYDVIIEGVSLINNYRVQFNKIINSESFEGLIRRMKDKLREEKALE